MKYGVIINNYEDAVEKSAGFNLGDSMQVLALLRLYKKMGISDDDICFIGMQHLHDYDGEYVILPIVGVGVIGRYAPPYSQKIIPIFISTHFVMDELISEQVQYIRNYAPVGCRDEWSLNIMRRYQIPAFLSGCITLLMGRDSLDSVGNRDVIYAIDVPEFARSYIQKQYAGYHVIYETHLLPFNSNRPMTHEEAIAYLDYAEETIKKYATAKLVISSRLHALIPAIANGTPVIGVFENISYRFSWLDKYIPLYTEDDVDQINWNPSVLSLDYLDVIEKVFIRTIRESAEKYSLRMDVSAYYENRHKSNYGNHYRKKLKIFFADSLKTSEPIRYMIFGCGLIGSVAYNIMQEEYPDAIFCGSLDNYVEGVWKSMPVVKPKDIELSQGLKIIVATYSGRHSAFEWMKKWNYKEGCDYCYIATTSG